MYSGQNDPVNFFIAHRKKGQGQNVPIKLKVLTLTFVMLDEAQAEK